MLTVLVADDEFAVLELLSLALEAEGHRVLKAGDGADALRLLVSQSCDVAVIDEAMPVMNGQQLIEAMQAHPGLAGLPVILMAEQPVASAGIVVMGKPVQLSELFQHLEQLGKSRRQP